MKTPLYKWNGKYYGFIYNDKIFDKDAKYKGWIDENSQAWNKDGEHIGELTNENYVLKKDMQMPKVPKIPKIPPIPPIPPIPKIDRVGKIDKIDWSDALNKL